MDEKRKVLVCGDVKGKFKSTFNRIEVINKKTGPYDLLLCVGDFFGDSETINELNAYKNGLKSIAIPTYILGSNTMESSEYYEDCTDGEICSNLTYLGKRGLYTVASGFKIAYVSGCESKSKEKNDWTFDVDDVKAVRLSCLSSKTSTGDYRGVDILITSQWPLNISEKVNDHNIDDSKLLAWLAKEIRPRYHFAGLKNQFYERSPYRVPSGNNTQLELSTRFIALANVFNESKLKYLYAMNIAPVEKMRIMDLIIKTTQDTACPFDSIEILNDVSVDKNESSQYFYDMGNNRRGKQYDQKRKGDNPNANKKRQRNNLEPESCWFCLSSSSVEKHLIISIGESFYLAFGKGSLDQSHFLILSITHIHCAALLSADEWKELNLFKDAIRKYYNSKNKVATFFERNYKSVHLQINAIAIEAEKEEQIQETFEEKGTEYNLEFEEIEPLTEATQLPSTSPYFVTELPNKKTLLSKQMKKFPINFGREVFCAKQLFNCPEKIDWRQCLLPPADEKEMVEAIRNDFKPYDFTNV